ncbi:MAG: PKD domain-containing protein [Candidatus Nealsonbacteria bacterium]|nr:PKD domain-containing protein [Candidatus Nealsonbacteria bacterium]
METNKMNTKIFLPSKSLRFFVFLLFFIASGLLLANSIYSVYDPRFNFMSNDLETLTLENRTTNPAAVNPGSANWRDPISASAGDAVSFRFYYHNGELGTVANNTKIRISYPTVAATAIIMTGAVWADNAAQVTDTGTINVSSAQTLIFENTAKWYPNQQTTGGTDLAVVNTGNSIEVNIGNIAGGWPSQGNIVFRATISNNPPPNHAPTADAGTNKDINENQSVVFSASASDPDADSLTYSWTCNTGTLSNHNILNPTYTAPSVTSDATYTCTLTVTDSHGLSASDSMNVLVRNIGGAGGCPNVYAGGTIYLNSGQSVTINATASDPNGSPLYYSWTCNGGTLSSYNVLNPIYYAPDLSYDTTYVCIITATNEYGNNSNSSANIVINGNNYGNLSVSLSANPSSGSAPLNNVSLTANVSGSTGSGLIVYRFDCENNNSFDTRYETYNTNYTAYNVCSYAYSGNYTAKVRVERGSYSAENTTNISVSGGYNNITVDAGTDKDISQGQSVILNGYVYGQAGYFLTYSWTCNGGTLSNSNSLSPTYYAPYVSSDIAYACTLYVTDNRGNSNSDSMNITVRKSGSYGNLSVTTNNAENITTDYATLKGTLVSDGGQNASVRFNWGRNSSYTNYTDWVYNKISGNIFTFNISGLEKGKVYHYRAEASNGKDSATGQDMIFITKPGSPTDFSATTLSSSEIQLRWSKGEGSCYTKVVRKRYGYPVNALDGVAVYYDSDNSYIDKNLNSGTTYYYRAWAVGCDEGKYSFSDSPNSKDYAVTGPGAAVVVESSAIILETLGRNITQKGKDWNDSISANSGDEVEFNIIVSADGNRLLENVVVKNTMPNRIGCIYDAYIDGQEYDGSLEVVNLGNISLNQSKVISFKGIVDSEAGPNCRNKSVSVLCGSNELILSTEVSARNAETVKSSLRIGVSNIAIKTTQTITIADIGQFLRDKFGISSLILLMLILIFLMMLYLIFERKKTKDNLSRKGVNAFRSPNL